MSTFRTYSKIEINLARPDTNAIYVFDVAAALGSINRYNGHAPRNHSVLSHSLMVYQYVLDRGCRDARVLRAALLHDATEAYLGDVSRPLKALLPDYQRLEAAWWTHLCRVWDMPLVLPEVVKNADAWACREEMALLWGDAGGMHDACQRDEALGPLLWGRDLCTGTFLALCENLGVPRRVSPSAGLLAEAPVLDRRH